MCYEGRIDRKHLKPGSILAGKRFLLNFEFDTMHVCLKSGKASHSDYLEISKRQYIICDLDQFDNVLGYGVEGFLCDFREKSLKGRIILALHLQNIFTSDLSRSVAAFVEQYLPDMDEFGKLRGHVC